jgi:hypothetical protein
VRPGGDGRGEREARGARARARVCVCMCMYMYMYMYVYSSLAGGKSITAGSAWRGGAQIAVTQRIPSRHDHCYCGDATDTIAA